MPTKAQTAKAQQAKDEEDVDSQNVETQNVGTQNVEQQDVEITPPGGPDDDDDNDDGAKDDDSSNGDGDGDGDDDGGEEDAIDRGPEDQGSVAGDEAHQEAAAEARKGGAKDTGDGPDLTPRIRVDNFTRRSGQDALEGSFVNVVGGDHQGRRGAFTAVAEYADDGYPTKAIVRTRDENADLLTVDYDDLRPAEGYRGGR